MDWLKTHSNQVIVGTLTAFLGGLALVLFTGMFDKRSEPTEQVGHILTFGRKITHKETSYKNGNEIVDKTMYLNVYEFYNLDADLNEFSIFFPSQGAAPGDFTYKVESSGVEISSVEGAPVDNKNIGGIRVFIRKMRRGGHFSIMFNHELTGDFSISPISSDFEGITLISPDNAHLYVEPK